MKNNTVVTASNMRYAWGVYLLIASMRRAGMDEPALVLADGYSEKAKDAMRGLGDVDVFDAPKSKRSMTCRKPEAMLLAETEFVTWADCDAFFTENSSNFLAPKSEGQIHIRKRGEAEMLASNLFGRNAEGAVVIDPKMTEVWRADVGGLGKPRLDGCCSACFMSLSMSRRGFLEKWRDQMGRVLPDDDVGVVDKRNAAYFQTDESVLNSLLCFLPDAPDVSPGFGLDRPARFVHFIDKPKPWIAWTRGSMRWYDEYVKVAEWAVESGLQLPDSMPFPLVRKNRAACAAMIPWIFARQKIEGAMRKAKKFIP